MDGHPESGGLLDRMLAAALSVLVTLPTFGLLWLWFNAGVAGSGHYVGTPALAVAIAAGAVIAFLFPRLFPNLIGRLWTILLHLARW
jgi:hypothetical protein